MAKLTREMILKQTKMKTKVVPVPEWGGEVTILEWTTAQRAVFELLDDDNESKDARIKNMRERAIIASVINDAGKMVFKEGDLGQISKLSAAATDRIFSAVAKLNHITSEDQDDLVKNSGKARS